MSDTNSPAPPFPNSLADVLQRELGRERATPYRVSARLEPVPLPPPPEAPAAGASPDDDLTIDYEAELERRRQIRIVVAGLGAAAVLLAAGWITFQLWPVKRPAVEAPIVRADPDAISKAPPPPLSVESDDRSANSPSEFIAPDTTGLSPARRITTIRIIVENDREVTRP